MTLSGPPSLLQDFLSLEPLRLARKLPLAIRGLFHAFHLPLLDLDAIIGHSDSFMRPVRAYGSLLNPKLQGDLDVPSLKNLLVRAVKDILQAPLDINDDTQQILGRLRGRDVQLTSVGPARIRHLERALIPIEIYRLGSRQLRYRDNPIDSSDCGESIAVVGMFQTPRTWMSSGRSWSRVETYTEW